MFILNHIGDDWNFNFSNYFWSISWNVPRKFNTHWTNSIHKLRKSFFPGHRTVEKNAEKIRNIVQLAENIWDENFEKKTSRPRNDNCYFNSENKLRDVESEHFLLFSFIKKYTSSASRFNLNVNSKSEIARKIFCQSSII